MIRAARVNIDQMHVTDRPFVLDSWLRSYEPEGLKGHERAKYYRNERVVAERCISHGRTMVATIPGPERQIVGWCCMQPGEPPIVHYVYVKSIMRGNGIAIDLVIAALDGISELMHDHSTSSWFVFLRALGKAGITCVR